MTDKQIIQEVKNYLADNTYRYAVLIDGEWGSGKTYFVKNQLTDAISQGYSSSHSSSSSISCYGSLFDRAKRIIDRIGCIFRKKILNPNQAKTVKYISLYGCKSYADIQDRVAMEFVVDFFDVQSAKNATKDKVRSTFQKVAGAFEHSLVAMNVVMDWIDVSSVLLVFDDIERCDCTINEVFGLINELVEHRGVKAILVTNEQELSTIETPSQKELQYIAILHDEIDWPVQEDAFNFGGGYRQTASSPITIEELDRRRQILFPSVETNKGITMHYQPNIKDISLSMLQKSDFDGLLFETIRKNIDSYSAYMEKQSHQNLRTFQFFLSRAKHIYDILNKTEIPIEYRDTLTSFVINDCFERSVEFKGNIAPPSDKWERIAYDIQIKMLSVKQYIETGELQEDLFKRELSQFVENHLLGHIGKDDPFSRLREQYYTHSQDWCKSRIDEVISKLSKNKYPISTYPAIVELFCVLIEIGFSGSLLTTIEGIMLTNINCSDNLSPFYLDMIHSSSETTRESIITVLKNLNTAIHKKSNRTKENILSEILKDDNWVSRLNNYTSDFHNISMAIPLLSIVEREMWLKKIQTATPADLCEFRNWLNELFPDNVFRQNANDDIKILQFLCDNIHPDEVSDCIQRLNLNWLQEQIKRILQLYSNKRLSLDSET